MSKSKSSVKGAKVFRIAVGAALTLLIAALAARVYLSVVRTVRTVAQSKVEDIASRAIHLAVRDASAECGGYSDIVDVYRTTDGRIQSLSLNAANANKLKSEIALKTLDYLDENENTSISIPIGNFTNSNFLVGVGPAVKLKVMPCSIADIDFKSSFTQAGINQVRHTVNVTVKVNIGAFLPNYEETTDITTTAIVTEAVIIGDVPQTYLNLNSGGKSNDRQH